jgi:flagellar hook-basal body complex protein FliE
MNPITINTLPQEISLPSAPPVFKPEGSTGTENFKDTLSKFVSSVNDLQTKAADAETSFLKGDITDVHQVMIAVEEASVAFELLMEIRNKLLDSYQQVVRMSI